MFNGVVKVFPSGYLIINRLFLARFEWFRGNFDIIVDMPSSSGHGMPFGTLRRSILGIGNDNNQVHCTDASHDPNSHLYCVFEPFQNQVFSHLHPLSAAPPDEFLSLDWMSKLLDAFMACEEDFKVVLVNKSAQFTKPPLDRLLAEYFDRSVKALDICNAVRDGIEKIRLWHKHLEIVSSAFDSKQRNVIVEGQFRRAKKALTDLAIVMLDENKESGSVFSHRNRSFGRPNKAKDHQRKPGHSRSLSWSVSNTWSATKQLQLMANSLIPPRANEVAATEGLANVIYTMGFVLMFVLWALVAAIPCQDRSLQIHFSVPKQFPWSTPLNLIHVRIMDESKKRDRKNTVGLLKQIYQMEKSVHLITDLVDSIHQFPLAEEQKEELQEGVQEVARVCSTFKNGLDPLERQLREVFRKIMSCRTEGLEILSRAQS